MPALGAIDWIVGVISVFFPQLNFGRFKAPGWQLGQSWKDMPSGTCSHSKTLLLQLYLNFFHARTT